MKSETMTLLFSIAFYCFLIGLVYNGHFWISIFVYVLFFINGKIDEAYINETVRRNK